MLPPSVPATSAHGDASRAPSPVRCLLAHWGSQVMWNRPNIDYVQTEDLPWSTIPAGNFGAGELHKVLSEDSDDGSRTALVRIRQEHQGRFIGAVDIYVLEGDGDLNGKPLYPGHYYYFPAGGHVRCRPDVQRTTLFVATVGSSLFHPMTSVSDPSAAPNDHIHLDTEELPWHSAAWASDSAPSVFDKLLRSSPEEVRLIAMLPGHKSDAEERHPTSEESFRICGDLLFGTKGLMTAGAYFFHRPDVWHCPSGTRTGSMSLVRTSGALTTEFRNAPQGSSWNELRRRGYANVRSPAVGTE